MKHKRLKPRRIQFRDFPILGFEFDREAKAIYFTVAEGEVAHTKRIEDSILLDVDGHGKTLGIEILRVKGFEGQLNELVRDLSKTYPLKELVHA